MSLQVRVKVNEYTDGTELQSPYDYFLRRSYAQTMETTVSLTASQKTEIETHLTDINVIYLVVTGNAADVNLYNGSSSEYYTFSDAILMVGVSNVTTFHLESSADTTVKAYICGT